MQKILFICHGNICRSPMAEFIFKALARAKGLEGEYYVESAAVSREEIGNHIYPPARRCLNQHGVPFDADKTARQVTKADYERFDRLVCMDSSNVRRLRDIVGGDAQKKIHLLMSYAGVGATGQTRGIPAISRKLFRTASPAAKPSSRRKARTLPRRRWRQIADVDEVRLLLIREGTRVVLRCPIPESRASGILLLRIFRVGETLSFPTSVVC